jgi:DMSO/TMAO reductase YedYZ heme-binding membrane subunit
MTLPLLLTSNTYAVKKLTKNWKVVQRLSYFMFVFAALHIYLVNPEKNFGITVVVGIWILLKILVANGVVIWKRKA